MSVLSTSEIHEILALHDTIADVMHIPMRVPAHELTNGDRVGGFIATSVEHHGVAPTGYATVRWGVLGKPDGYYAYTGYVTLERPTAGMVPCPECGDAMSVKRLSERALQVTQGLCSECVAYPRRHAAAVERERRVAAFGANRC